MAKNKNRKVRKKKYQASRDSGPPRRRRDGAAAMRGMLVGGGLILLFVLLLWPFGGQSVVGKVIESMSAPAEKPAPAQLNKPAAQKSVKIGGSAPNSNGPAVSDNAAKAAPLEKVSDKSQADLDKLIDSKTK